ncbi:MAG: GtrA family protein [Rhodospirillales bacterium]|nr:GtrA family protein [Rhodospirillales bacterium]
MSGSPLAPALPHRPVLGQFVRFGVVGTFGFLVDTSTVYGLRAWLGLYGAGAAAYLTAASANWLLNRLWTFRGQGSLPAHHQWARFLAVNLFGFAVNRGTYFALITWSVLCARQPVFAVAAGAIAGLGLNFHFSRTVAFK